MTTAHLHAVQPLTVTTSPADHSRVCVVSASGELDASNAPELVDALCKCDQDKPHGIVVDLTDLSFCSSSAIHAYEGLRQHHQPDTAVALALGTGAARRTFHHAGCDTATDVNDTLGEAAAQVL